MEKADKPGTKSKLCLQVLTVHLVTRGPAPPEILCLRPSLLPWGLALPLHLTRSVNPGRFFTLSEPQLPCILGDHEPTCLERKLREVSEIMSAET